MKINKAQVKVVIRNEQGQQRELTLAEAANMKLPAALQLNLVDAVTGLPVLGLGLRKAGQDLVLVDEDGKAVERVENFYDATATASQGEDLLQADTASGYVYAAQAQNQNQDSGAAAVPPQSQSSVLPSWLLPLGGGLALAGLANSGGGGSGSGGGIPAAPANTTPVVTNNSAAAAGTAVEAGHLDNGTVVPATVATGTLTANDPDVGETLNWSIQGTNSTTYGTFAVNSATGVWTYTLDNSDADTQALAEGQTVTQSYVVRVTDNLGAFADQTVTVTIQGTNDKPVISDSSVITGEVTEDNVGLQTATGTIVASDVDVGAAWTFSADHVQGTYGTFYIDAHTGIWTYALDNSRPATQALAAGAEATDVFNVTARDEKGAISVGQAVSITVNGTNDGPTITSNAAAAAGTVTENGTTTATGTLTASDLDTSATKSWSVQGASTDSYGGTFAVNSSTGVWTYTLDDSEDVTQALAEGQTVTQSYTVRVSDGTATVDQTVTITIRGTNDAPVIVTGESDLEGSVTEDVSGQSVVNGKIVAGDVDTGAVLSYSANSVEGIYGRFHIDTHTGEWTYTLDNDRAATQALGGEDSYEEEFTVSVRDDKGAIVSEMVTITVNGTNDAPTISAGLVQGWSGYGEDNDGYYAEEFSAARPSLVEDNGYFGFGEDWEGQSFYVTDMAVVQLAISDVDAQDNLTLRFAASNANVAPEEGYGFWDGIPFAKGVYGYAYIEPGTQKITYAITDRDTQALAQGQVVYDSFTVVVDDGNGGTSSVDVVFSVTGTNDSPTVVFVPSDNGFVPYERYGNNGQYDFDYWNSRNGYEIGNTRTVNEDGDVSFSGRQFNSRANNSIKLNQNDVDNFTILNLVDGLSGETNLDNNAVVGEDGNWADETFIVEAQAAIKTIDILVSDEQGAVVAVPAQDLYYGWGEDDGLQVVLGTNRGDDFAFVGNTKDAVMFGFDGDDVYNFQIDGKANHITIADWVNTSFDQQLTGEDGEYHENDRIESGSQLNWNDTLKVMFDNDWAQSLQYAPRAYDGYLGPEYEYQVSAAVNDTITGIGRGDNDTNVITGVVKAAGSLKFTLNTTADGGYEASKSLHISTDNPLTITGGDSAISRAAVTGSDEIDFTFNSIVNVEVEIIRLLNALQAVYGQTVSVTEITDVNGPTGLFEFTITNVNLTANSAVIYDDGANDYRERVMGDRQDPVDGYITFSEWYDYGDYVTVTVGNKTYDYLVSTLGGVSGDVLANHFLGKIHDEGVTWGINGSSIGSNAAFGDSDIGDVIDGDTETAGWQPDASNRATYDDASKTITIYNAYKNNGEFNVASSITEHSHMIFDGSWAQGNLHVIGAEHGSHLIYGGTNDDILIGGNGFDRVLGDVGRDTINGGAGNDLIMGLAGDDVLTSGTGYDTIIGGSGDDTIYLTSDENEITSAQVVFDTFGVNGHDVINNFSAGVLDSWSRSVVPGGDVLDFTAFLGAGTLANNTAQVEIDGYNYSRLEAFGQDASVDVNSGQAKLITVKVGTLANFDSVGEIVTALDDGGSLDGIDIAQGGKAVLVLAENGGTSAEVFFINNFGNPNDYWDNGADVNRWEINHAASLRSTSTDMIDNLLTANFMIA